MVVDVLLISIILIVLIISAYCDIKTREIPDWLNFSFIFAAFGIRAILSTLHGINFLISGIIGFIICFGLAYLFYYTNQWGGGDSKLLMGVGAAIGVSYPLSSESLQLLWFFLALLFFGALWGLFWMIGVAIKKRDLFMVHFKLVLQKQKILHLITLIITLFLIIFTLFYNFIWPLTLLIPITFYLMIFVTSVEKSCFFVRRNPKDLTEGDWLAEKIMIGDKTLLNKKTLVKQDLVLLKKNKIISVLIKEGIPFTPAFLIAYLIITFLSTNISQLLQSFF